MKPELIKFMIEAADMDRAVSFYKDTLGLEVTMTSPYWSELSYNGAMIGIHGGGDESEKTTGLSFQYKDVRAAYDAAIAAGATTVQAPQEREGEPIIFSSVRDLEGNVIMLTQYIGH